MDQQRDGSLSAARAVVVVLLAAAGLAACATPQPRLAIGGPSPQAGSRHAPPPGSTTGLRGTEKPYQIKGLWYYPRADPSYDQTGIGSWYGEQFHNRRTANGEIFDMDLPSAAHKTLPLPSLVEVINLDNGRRMTVRVNDRGPFVDDRIIDLSRAAADQLGYRRDGVARVRVRYIGPAPKSPFDGQTMAAIAPPPAYPYRSPQTQAAPVFAAAPPRSPQIQLPAPVVVAAAPPPTPLPVAPPTVTAGYRIQAGAFANRDNAERAVAQLSGAGAAVIEPLARAGGVLYRVLVAAGGDEGEAWSVRDRVAALGFSDATVLRP
ncbi:MAG: septal ring lytic transglycosylase RlpA family protein [Caulobacter sp.]|nr:septal ring lytic transglycosylase RlpA family protein [Caulobacter sp.]